MFTIGQVSDMFHIPISTLRYYDKEGLFPGLERASGIRRFGEAELEALRVIECLKQSGLEIKDIKRFMQWCCEGSRTYPQRKALFEQQRVAVAERIEIVFHGDVNGTLDDADHLVGVEEAGWMEPSLPRGKTAGADKGDFLKHQVGFSLLFYCARRCERRRFSV